MKKSVTIFLLSTILFHSSVTYQKQSVSINQATEKGKVKVLTSNGKNVIFDKVINENGSYYGIYSNQGQRIPIDTTRTSQFYLKKSKHDKSYQIWVCLKNSDKSNRLKGHLYEVKEESILVSLSNPVKKKPDVETTIMEYQVSNIEKVQLRASGNVATGAIIGFAIAGIPWILAIPSEPEYAAAGLLISAVPAAIIGGLLGTIKKRYEVNGSIEQYSLHKSILKERAFIKQKEY